MTCPPVVLFLDTASPVVSVAIAAEGEVLSQRTIELRRSSEQLLQVIEEALLAADVARGDLTGVAAMQGPGSFTGLRVGLATALGLHQALKIHATALPTLPVLAAAAGHERGDTIAAVDAIRGEWMVQSFRCEPSGVAVSEPELRSAHDLLVLAPARIIGFGVTGLVDEPGWREAAIELIEPPPLAPVAARHWSPERIDWDPSRLSAPIYFRPPAVTPPK